MGRGAASSTETAVPRLRPFPGGPVGEVVVSGGDYGQLPSELFEKLRFAEIFGDCSATDSNDVFRWLTAQIAQDGEVFIVEIASEKGPRKGFLRGREESIATIRVIYRGRDLRAAFMAAGRVTDEWRRTGTTYRSGLGPVDYSFFVQQAASTSAASLEALRRLGVSF